MFEANLIEKIREGDESALKEVYLKYKPEFIAWSRKYFDLDTMQASEIYVLSITALFENIKKGKLTTLDSQLKTYLFGIGKNKVKEYKRVFNNRDVDFSEYYLLEKEADNDSSDLYDQSEIKALQKGLKKLGNPCKKLLESFYLDGKSMEEIATEYQYKSATVAKTQKYKCIQRLKKIVKSFI